MKDSQDSWSCIECDSSFLYGGDPVKARCPYCDSLNLTRFIRVQDCVTSAVNEYLILKCKDPSFPSKRKVRREIRTGRRPEDSGSGRLVDELRIVDADLDHYQERIIDVRTGCVIRDVTEPLSHHRGGSEKRRKARRES